MKTENIDQILTKLYAGPSKWELDNVIYHDRFSNVRTLHSFLSRIKELNTINSKSKAEETELQLLQELLDELDDDEVNDLINQDDFANKDSFIEDLARKSAIESMTLGRLNIDTLETACKLSPNDFILCAKRTQDLMNSIQSLVIKGENLSKDVAGA